MTALAPAPALADVKAERTPPLAWLGDRGMGASILIAAISSAFGVALLTVTNYLAADVRASVVAAFESVQLTLSILSWLFIGIAMYVAAIVTANTFSTIIAGRTRQIALMRLIGASAESERAQIARQGLVIGAMGAVIGWLLVIGAALIALPWVNDAVNAPPGFEFTPISVASALPPLVVIATTVASAWIGSRRVLTVTPLAALSGSVDRAPEDIAAVPRKRGAIAMLLIGAVLLGLGVVVGLASPMGVVIAFFGGLLSFTGLAVGAVVIMPPVLRLVGRLFGRSTPARLAAENAMRYPERSSRRAIGVVMAVTLVVMFSVAAASVNTMLFGSAESEIQDVAEIAAILNNIAAIMMVLVSISAVIAGVGLINLLTISIVQRTRELGLLRALGLTKTQIRAMVMLEAAHIAIASLATGLVLGTIYGWAAAQSTLGSARLGGAAIVWPNVPWGLIVGVIAATVVLTLVASVVPTRLATRVAPVQALAVD